MAGGTQRKRRGCNDTTAQMPIHSVVHGQSSHMRVDSTASWNTNSGPDFCTNPRKLTAVVATESGAFRFLVGSLMGSSLTAMMDRTTIDDMESMARWESDILVLAETGGLEFPFSLDSSAHISRLILARLASVTGAGSLSVMIAAQNRPRTIRLHYAALSCLSGVPTWTHVYIRALGTCSTHLALATGSLLRAHGSRLCA